MTSKETTNNWEKYYTQEYFSGQGLDSPYPKDGRYLDAHHPIIERKFRDLYQVLMGQEPIRHHGRLRLLDLGCGPAHTEKIFSELDSDIDVYNTDGFFQVAKLASENGGSRVAVADITALPYASNTFGAVTIWDVIEHVPKEKAVEAFSEIYRVLDFGGAIAIRTPNRFTWTGKYRKDKGHLWFATPSLVKDLLIQAGFVEDSLWIKTRGFPGTKLYQDVVAEGDLYMNWGGGIIVATGKK